MTNIAGVGKTPHMSEPQWKKRLQEAIGASGKSPRKISLEAGLSATYLREILQRGARPTVDSLQAICGTLGIQLTDLFETEREEILVPVVGIVGAGAQIFPVDDYAQGEGLEHVPPPPDATVDTVAVEVRGDSMSPMAEEGWLLFYNKRQAPPPAPSAKRPYIVWTEDERVMVKKIKKGGEAGRYHLLSVNPSYEPEFDVLLGFAALVTEIRPR